MSHRYHPALDGLRGLAVGIVLLAHAEAPFPRSGGVGVDIFFTLSGFLITGLLLKEHAQYGSISLRNFYVRRSLRLVPCLWMTVLFVLAINWILGPHKESKPLEDAAFAVTYTMNWIRAANIGGSGDLAHTWSLAIEEQYYLIWPLVILGICRWVPDARSKAWLLLGLAVLAMGYRALFVGHVNPGRIYFGLDTHADGLLMGSSLACFMVARGERPLMPRARAIMATMLNPLAYLALLAVMYLWTWGDPAMGYVGYAIVAVASTIIIFDLVMGCTPWLRRCMELRPLVFVGKISYGLYLWHFPIYQTLDRIDFMYEWKVKLIIGGSLTLLVSIASYYLVELRFLKLKDRFVRREEWPVASITAASRAA